MRIEAGCSMWVLPALSGSLCARGSFCAPHERLQTGGSGGVRTISVITAKGCWAICALPKYLQLKAELEGWPVRTV